MPKNNEDMQAIVAIFCRWIFFFQAEDGIRDSSVTGVQTCALPIFAHRYLKEGTILPPGFMDTLRRDYAAVYFGAVGDPRVPGNEHAKGILLAMRFELDRSEERRVGKECRSRWSPYH